MKTNMEKSKVSIKYGDLFRLGKHILINGDCRDEEVNKLIPKEIQIRSVISDPPYGIDYVKSKNKFGNIKVKKDIIGDELIASDKYEEFITSSFKGIIKHLYDKNNFYIFNSDKMLIPLIEGMKTLNVPMSQLLIWVKNQPVISRKDYLLQQEIIFLGWHGKHYYRKTKDKSVLFCPKPQKSQFHPTQKPVSLIRRLILNSTDINDWVYDPFGGSGTTLIAAEQTKRKCLLVELDSDYCRTTIERFERISNQKAIKV